MRDGAVWLGSDGRLELADRRIHAPFVEVALTGLEVVVEVVVRPAVQPTRGSNALAVLAASNDNARVRRVILSGKP